MKCFLVVNQLNDPLYIDYDSYFANYIILRAKEKGLLENESIVKKLDANLVMQIFSPLVLSQWLLIDQTKEPCSTIVCPNGFLFVFKQMDDLLFLTINGDGSETEASLQRKVEVFITLMKFIFGPVSEEMGQSHFYSRKAKWNFLQEIMKSWESMVQSEQAFLVEAIERLHVNQEVNQKCIEILEKTVKQLQISKEQTINHAVLLVNSKLLALYSNRGANELKSKDILSLTILAKTIYPYSENIEDLFSIHYTGGKTKSKATDEDYSDGGEDEYHSAPNTPGGHRSRSPSIVVDSEYHNSQAAGLPSGQSESFHRDSLTHSSLSRSGTIKNSNHDSYKKLEYSDEPSLLEMYSEKYPDTVFKSIKSESDTQILAQSSHEQGMVQTFAEVYDDQKNRYLAQTSESSTSNVILSNKIKIENLRETDSTRHVHSEHSNSNIQNTASALVGESELQDESSPHSLGAVNMLRDNQNDNVVLTSIIHNEVATSTTTVKAVEQLSVREDNKFDQSAASSRSSSAGIGGKNSRSSTLSFEPNIDTFTPSRTSSVLSNLSKSYPELSPNDGQGFMFSEEDQYPSKEDVPDSTRQPKKQITPANLNHSSQLPGPSLSLLEETIGSKSSFNSYWPQSVFLDTHTCPYSPYNLHCLQVLPGVTLILLSQAPKHQLAESIFPAINHLQDLLYKHRIRYSRTRGSQVYEFIHSFLTKLHSNLKKIKGRISSLSFDLHSRWEKDDLKRKLTDYLEKDLQAPITKELESQLLEVYKKLKELFSHLFLTPQHYSPQLVDALSQVRIAISKDLQDYREYLNVKAQRNITMTSYIDEFPGLIHFIFVDRLFHQMSAPSLNISLNLGENTDATSFLKEKIWSMYQHVMCKLTEGYTTVLLREGDFYFSYFLWFEDYLGNPLPVQESFKPSSKFSFPGILSGSFYRALLTFCFPHAIQNSVHCLEMFLIHLGTVHPEYISAHCKRLAHKMREMTGETYKPVSLL
ncbi:Hermansky-Pudlak syndrome 1 protein [Biomphalaria glabrata]|nr:Hermansky-Pudlak syndrome 1 protein [Biomphalaria glabrata]